MGSLRSLHRKEKLERVAPAIPTDELFNAICSQDIKEVNLLLALGANPNAMSAGGMTALTHAVSLPKLAIAKSLIEFGAEVNFKNEHGLTALMVEACLGTSLFGLRFLVKNGADIDAVDHQGATALMLAISPHKFAQAELLIDEGADVTVKDHSGKTALDLLEGMKDRAAAGLRELLKEHS